MNFELAYIPAILLTGMVYLFVFVGLWKNEIRKVYSRRTKREKILSIGVAVMAVVATLFIAARQGADLPVMGDWTLTVHEMLLWFLSGSAEMLAMAVFLVCSIPVALVSAIIIDEIGQKNTALALPFYYYIITFMVERLFYEPLTVPVTGWFVLLLLATAIYCYVKARFEGTNKKKKALSALLIIGIFVVVFVEKAVPTALIWQYIVLLALNTGMSFVINRASVLKKKYWYAVTLICFAVLFFVGRLF